MSSWRSVVEWLLKDSSWKTKCPMVKAVDAVTSVWNKFPDGHQEVFYDSLSKEKWLKSFYLKDLCRGVAALADKVNVTSAGQLQPPSEATLKEALDGLETSIPRSDLRKLSIWLTKQTNGLEKVESSQSSGIPKESVVDISSDSEVEQQSETEHTQMRETREKVANLTIQEQPSRKRKSATSTSTTPAHSKTRIVDADSSEDTDSSDGMEEELFSSVMSQQNTSVNGCNTTVVRQGESYTWRSAKFPPYKKLVKLEIWEEPKKYRRTNPMQRWRQASFRSTMLIGNPMEPHSLVERLVKDLRKEMIQESTKFPGVVSDRRQNFNRE